MANPTDTARCPNCGAALDERLASVLLWALLTLDGVDAVER